MSEINFAHKLSQTKTLQILYQMFAALEKKYGGQWKMIVEYDQGGMSVDVGHSVKQSHHDEIIVGLEKLEVIQGHLAVLEFLKDKPNCEEWFASENQKLMAAVKEIFPDLEGTRQFQN